MSRKKSVAVLSLLIVLLVGGALAGISMAYLNYTEGKQNLMEAGILNVHVDENDGKGFDPPGDNKTEAAKKIQIANGKGNDSTTIAYVRAAIIPTFRNASGSETRPADIQFPASSGTGNKITITCPDGSTVYEGNLYAQWRQNWIYGGDGFYYYKRSVKPGEKTTQLLETVTRQSAEAGKDWQGLQIEVLAEGISATQQLDEQVATWPVKVGANEELVLIP